jgi:parallel beta-helix repeat protein
MLRPLSILPLAPLAVLALACSDQPVGPGQAESADPVFSADGVPECPSPVDHVATDKTELLEALSSASGGDVIGLDGYFPVTADVVIDKQGLTLTCVTPGSGLYAEPGAGVKHLLLVLADGVTLERLVLDATDAEQSPILAFGGPSDPIEGFRLTRNRLTCSRLCAWLIITPGAEVSDNYLESHGSNTGVQIQSARGVAPEFEYGAIDGVRVTGNTIVATEPSGHPSFGGIRIWGGLTHDVPIPWRDPAFTSRNILIADNHVLGPWQNSISPWWLSESEIRNNRLEGANLRGILLSRALDNVIRSNRMTGAGQAGLWLNGACRNALIGNNLNGNNDDWGVIFDPLTGDNILVGNQNTVVDDGLIDCDDDTYVDPNIITGGGAVLHDVKLGERISVAASGLIR